MYHNNMHQAGGEKRIRFCRSALSVYTCSNTSFIKDQAEGMLASDDHVDLHVFVQKGPAQLYSAAI